MEHVTSGFTFFKEYYISISHKTFLELFMRDEMRYERLHGRILLRKITTYVASCRHASEDLTDPFSRRSYNQQDSQHKRYFKMSIECIIKFYFTTNFIIAKIIFLP